VLYFNSYVRSAFKLLATKMRALSGVQTREIFSGTYSVPTIILVKICYFISILIFKHAHSLGGAVSTVLFFSIIYHILQLKDFSNYIACCYV